MPGEQRGDERCRPQRAGQPEQQEQEQNRIHRVKQHVDGMMGAGIEAEEFTIRHVRKPRERMPVAPMTGGEGPLDSSPRQTILDGAIFRHVGAVVIVHKAVVRHRQVSQQRDEREQQTHEARTGHRASL